MPAIGNWGEVASLPIDPPPPYKAPMGKVEKPSDEDMGLNGPNNIIYVNMEGPGIAERFKERLNELTQMLQLTHQLATIHAGIQVMRRKEEGALPGDDSEKSQWLRAQYRVRVMDTYFNDGIYAWIYSPRSERKEKEFKVEKRQFHWELLATMLAGLVMPRPIAAALEALFQGVSDTIQKTEYAADRHSFWSMMQVYTYDEVRDDLRASLRNINYVLDQQMHTVSKRKSTMTNIDIYFAFGQADFEFNERTWNRLRREVEEYIEERGGENIRDPPEVPV
ncbi:hypothetical protein CDD82_2314 [Ophiocordyceps australis]|uniref:Uncharacterized protein n=1 Tax=Ophiocordyceps australis TaxID=1399860 RepID=A0A2C5XY60_9HYPO|nr:hypothetical protein CDD82_2314 [Ophiocordyceps australis]